MAKAALQTASKAKGTQRSLTSGGYVSRGKVKHSKSLPNAVPASRGRVVINPRTGATANAKNVKRLQRLAALLVGKQ